MEPRDRKLQAKSCSQSRPYTRETLENPPRRTYPMGNAPTLTRLPGRTGFFLDEFPFLWSLPSYLLAFISSFFETMDRRTCGRSCFMIFLLILVFRHSSQCEENDFLCQGGKCLPAEKVCDGYFDCEEGDDENNCDHNIKCESPTWFRCKDGTCLSSLMYCDGNYDCNDQTDEPENCTADGHMSIGEATCTPDEFMCLNKHCIKKTWVCDGDPDCLDGSDETIGCRDKFDCGGGFRCKNHHCIMQEFHCDGHDDCGDNSDEENCTARFHSVDQCYKNMGLFLCTDGIACIEAANVCDGFPHCFDKSDEQGCSAPNSVNQTYCKSLGCSHDCHLAPNKTFVCTCPTGYKLDGTMKKCIDLDECEEFGFCYQKCQNTMGGFQCSCDSGYNLLADNRTCRAKGGEALLLFSSFNQIRGIYVKSQVYFSVSTLENRPIGVSHNGRHVYWTEFNRSEALIVRSNEDGTEKVVIVNSGLGLPEGLAVDYVTGNIYFTDVEKKHIGVCTEASVCAVLHNKEIDKPRAIALYPQKGVMFWSDWGNTPKIATSGMDGSNPRAVVEKDVEWPNGLALDVSNDRLYWVDAKTMSIETVRLDGTDRRVILKQAVRHPFSISVFENMLYWSDWENLQIEMCNKFTGKDHSFLIKEMRSPSTEEKNKQNLFGVHIYHPALQPRVENPCKDHACADLCLLSPNNTYKCACREEYALSADLHTCRKRSKTLQVAVGGKTHLHLVSPRLLGKQLDTEFDLSHGLHKIDCMTYDSLTGSFLISDSVKKKIFRYNIQTNQLTPVLSSGLGKITSMSFDAYGNNLYVCDEEKRRVEAWSLISRSGVPLYKAGTGDIPHSVVVVPDHGVFFVAVVNDNGIIFINRINMDGTQISPHIMATRVLGPRVGLSYDKKTQKIFWFDSGIEIIESIDLDGSNRQIAQVTEGTPSAMVSQDGLLMWVNEKMTNFYSYEIPEDFSTKSILKMDVSMESLESMAVVTEIESRSLHPCQDYNKHRCSHICLVTSHIQGVCACPLGMHLNLDNRTCLHHAHCSENQFKCRTDDICISRIQRCDGHADCPSGDDEKDCEINNCKQNQFKCDNGQCIAAAERCDNVDDCSDHSDEAFCPFTCKSTGDNFQCGSGECIPKLWKCDFNSDCSDGSDENNCENPTCDANMFQCKSGMCISAGWECDGDLDCSDASDEHENCEPITCKPTDYRCGNGRCVSMKLMCNGENDCGDGTDELHCDARETEPICGVDEILCSKANPKCVPQASRCNGTTECPRGEDEMDCINCLPTEYQCKNFKCISSKWVCDKENDCGDNSDEDATLCARRLGTVGNAQPCQEFSCKSGECIPLHLVCNGLKNCQDGSDEGPNCDTVCKRHPCSQICVATPLAARCACQRGYTLGNDGSTCHDVDECAEQRCSQLCQNTPGGFNCSCVDDYLLKSDRVTCKAKGGRMSFILSGDDEIRKVTHNFNTMDLLVFDPGAQILGLDVDTRRNQVYWSSGSSNKISVLDIETGHKTFMEDIDRPGKLSYDWLTGNVYYVDHSSPNSIKVCHLANKKRSTVLTVSHGVVISDIAVDPPSGLIFYTQARSSALQRPVSEILSYSFADENSTVLVSSDVSWVSGLVVDRIRKYIYWSDLYHHVIEKVKFDGGQRQIVFQSQVHRPESLVMFEDSLIWLTRGSSELKKCVLYGEYKGHCDTISLYVYDIKFVTIMQEARQPNMTNPCADHCDIYSICVATPDSSKCLCEDGSLIGPNEICDQSHVNGLSNPRANYENSKEFLTAQNPPLSGSSSTVIAILVTALTVCGLFAIYLYVKKKKSNVILETMHFHNPSFGLSHLENNYHHSDLVPGEHRYENPAAKLIQHPDGKYGVLFREKERKEKSAKVDYDSDSDTYERTDMKANLIR